MKSETLAIILLSVSTLSFAFAWWRKRGECKELKIDIIIYRAKWIISPHEIMFASKNEIVKAKAIEMKQELLSGLVPLIETEIDYLPQEQVRVSAMITVYNPNRKGIREIELSKGKE